MCAVWEWAVEGHPYAQYHKCVSNDSFCVDYNSVCGVKHWVFASVAVVLHCFISSSIQNCPVNDLLSDAMSKGLHQTMSTDAVLTVTVRKSCPHCNSKEGLSSP